MALLLPLLVVLLPGPAVHVALVMTPRHVLPAAIERAALAEAAAIWSQAGLVIDSGEGSGRAPADAVVLTVVISARTPAATGPARALGAIDFAADGTPGRVISVFLDRLMRLLDNTGLDEQPLARRPREMRERAIGRAIGRIIAHEIGHFVLRSAEHTRQGLMAAMFRTDDLIAPARGRYYLRP